jgi:Mg2+/Co2+ transporter CorC
VELDFPHGNILEPDAKRLGIAEGDMEDEVDDRNKQNILSLRGHVFALHIGDFPIEQFTDRCNLHLTDAFHFNSDLI